MGVCKSQAAVWSIVIVTLKIYGDESSDEKKKRVFAIAAVGGTDDDWAPTMKEWMRRNRGLEFHAVDCADQELFLDLSEILAKGQLSGVVVTLDLQSFSRCFPRPIWGIDYYKCFVDVLSNLATMVRAFNDNPEERVDAKMKFTFDSRKASDGSAAIIYDLFRQMPEWADTTMFDTTVEFEGGPEPRLEVPDLLVYEARKELDRKLNTPTEPSRSSYKILRDAEFDGAKKFVWIERDSAYCEEWKKKTEGIESQEMFKSYKPWLEKNGCVQNGHFHDNAVNRTRFLAWLDSQEVLTNGKSRQKNPHPAP